LLDDDRSEVAFASAQRIAQQLQSRLVGIDVRACFETNAQLGTDTNFANLLDLAGVACPVSLAPEGTAYGVPFLLRPHAMLNSPV